MAELTKTLKRYQLILFPLLSITLVAIVGLLVLKVWWADVKQKKEAITVYEDRIGQMVAKLDTLNSQSLEKLDKYIVELSVAVTDRAVPPLVIASIENEVVDSGLYLNNIFYRGVDTANTEEAPATSPEELLANEEGDSAGSTTGEILPTETDRQLIPETTIDDGRGTIGVQVDVQGEMAQMIHFLNRLQSIRPLMSIEEISITDTTSSSVSNNTEEDTAVLSKSMSVTVDSPFAALSKSIGGPSAPITELSPKEIEMIEKVLSYDSLYDEDTIDPTDQYQTGKSNPF